MPSPSLGERVVRGVAWFAALNGTIRVVGLVRVVVLARLLTPHDFGLMAIAFVTLLFLEAVSTTGTQLALIRRQDAPHMLLDTAWTLGLLRNALIAVSLIVAAPFLGDFFSAPEVVPVLRVMALASAVQGLTNIGIVTLSRDLTFRRYYVLQISGVAADLGVALGFALWLGTVWALVAGAIAHATVRVVVSYLVHPYRPRIRLRGDDVRELYRYGRWVAVSSIFEWALVDGVHGMIGHILGVRVLGVYRVAWQIASLPAGQVGQPVASVTVGAYARLQESSDRVGRAYLRVLTATASIVWPVTVAIMLYADPIVRLILGSHWADTAPVIRILALLGLLRSVSSTWRPLFHGVGRPGIHASAIAMELTVVVALVWPLTQRFGVVGPAIAVVIGAGAGFAVACIMLCRITGVAARELLAQLGGPGLACLPWVIVAGSLVAAVDSAGELVAHCAIFAVVYVAVLLFIDRLGLYRLDRTVFATVRQWMT